MKDKFKDLNFDHTADSLLEALGLNQETQEDLFDEIAQDIKREEPISLRIQRQLNKSKSGPELLYRLYTLGTLEGATSAMHQSRHGYKDALSLINTLPEPAKDRLLEIKSSIEGGAPFTKELQLEIKNILEKHLGGKVIMRSGIKDEHGNIIEEHKLEDDEAQAVVKEGLSEDLAQMFTLPKKGESFDA